MKEEPLKLILDRELFEHFATEGFSSSLELLAEVVNYGTNLMPRALESSPKKLPDVVIIMNFLSNAVAMLDGIHVLSCKSAVTPAYLSLRALLEANIYLAWMLKERTEDRAVMYFVWELRQRLLWARRCKIGAPEFQEQAQHMTDAPGPMPKLDQKLIDAEIALLEKKLNTPECRTMNAAFQELAQTAKREPQHWYALEKVHSLAHMAELTNMRALYRVFYGGFSRFMHSQTIDRHVTFGKGRVIYEPIRSPLGLNEVIGNGITIAFAIYELILERYRPDELKNSFPLKYRNEWRERYRTIPKVVRKGGTYSIVPTHWN